MTLNDKQIKEIERLKNYFPYRIVFGVIDKETKLFEVRACKTKAPLNKAVKAGHSVFLAE